LQTARDRLAQQQRYSQSSPFKTTTMQLWLTATIWYTSCLTCSPQLLRCLKSAIAEQPSLSCCQVRHCGAALISTRCLKSATSGAALKSQSRFFPVLSPVHADSAAVLEIFTYAVSVHATTSKCSSPHNFLSRPYNFSQDYNFSLAMHFSLQFYFYFSQHRAKGECQI
jgi:hypothetical protein